MAYFHDDIHHCAAYLDFSHPNNNSHHLSSGYYVPGAVLRSYHKFSNFILTITTHKVNGIVISVLQMKKLRHR